MPKGMYERKPKGAVRQTRDAETHDMVEVHPEEDKPWVRGASLDMPPARSGMDQRWIRVSIGGRDDATNWARKQREGWRPRAASSVPEDFPVPKIDQGKFAGFIGIEGNVLCERPMAISKRRDAHFRAETDRRTAAINHDLERVNKENQNPAFGPIRMGIESKKVREVNVQPDANE